MDHFHSGLGDLALHLLDAAEAKLVSVGLAQARPNYTKQMLTASWGASLSKLKVPMAFSYLHWTV